MQTRTLSTYLIPAVRERVDAVNARADKLGLEGVHLEVSDPYDVEVQDDLGFIHDVRVADVTVTGPTVVIEGWTFLASVDHRENLVKASPAADEDENFRRYAFSADCDHCGMDRDRLSTFVLGNEDGKRLQVGSTCLKDFLGHDVSLTFIEQAMDAEDDVFEVGGYAPSTWSLSEFLLVTEAVIRQNGWVPRSRSWEGTPTADLVTGFLFAPNAEVRDSILPDGVPVEEDALVAKAAKAWAEALPEDVENDYLYNVRQVAVNGYVTTKSAGIAASIISAYRRSETKRVEREVREAERAEAEPVPLTGKRETVEGVVLKVDWKENAYGSRQVFTVQDDRGFRIWGTVPSAIYQVAEGDRVRYDARLEASDRDEKFGFHSRPTKAEILG